MRLLVGIAGLHGGLRIANPKVEGRVKVEGLGYFFIFLDAFRGWDVVMFAQKTRFGS